MPALDLPDEPSNWQEVDEELALARALVRIRTQEWRVAGGYYWNDEQVGQPEKYARIIKAKDEYRYLTSCTCPGNMAVLKSFCNRKVENEGSVADAVDTVISWLEADPFGYATGYDKKAVMHRLARTNLTEKQKDKLRLLLLRLLKRGNRAEFREACYLARRVKNDAFEVRLSVIIKQSAGHTRPVHFAARQMLETCQRPFPKK